LLPVFFVLALGHGAGRRKFIDSRNASTLNQLAMVFALPASLFVSISCRQRSAIASHGTYILVIVIAMLLVYAVILWLQLKVFRLDKGPAAVQARTVSFPNLASIGLPLSSAVVGNHSAIAAAGSAPPRPALAGPAKTPPRNRPPMLLPAASQVRTRNTTGIIGKETTHALRITSL
jgi:predicted permease